MPRVSIDYSKTVIYRIVCKDPTIKDCYVGSTTDFKSRKKSHKSNCNNDKQKKHYNLNIYQFIRKNGGWNNFDMIEIEKYNAIDHLDQLKQERYWLEFYQATLNMVIPSRTDNEYNEIYWEKHKDKLTVYRRELHQRLSDEKREEYNRKCLEKYYRNKEQRLMGLEDKCVI